MTFVGVAWNEEITSIYCDIAIECTEIINQLKLLDNIYRIYSLYIAICQIIAYKYNK